jgi:ribulose-5-phosphate 4-epimerase/fuculose-1-phosphate aldolase
VTAFKELFDDLARANRILANENVVDAFGHISVRHPENSSRYFLSRSISPDLVQPEDIREYTLDSEPVKNSDDRHYIERVIHGEIYKARPDVMAVCHHHAPEIIPYAITGEKLVPVFLMAASMGATVPHWDQRKEFGDTNLLVSKPEEGRSLARVLGPNWVVIMSRHGATVAGRSLREVMFRTYYSVRNASLQTQAKLIGEIQPLSAGEIEKSMETNLQPGQLARAWGYWSKRLDRLEGLSGKKSAPAKRSAVSKKKKRKKRK